MSSLLYGALTQRRLDTPPDRSLVTATVDTEGNLLSVSGTPANVAEDKVKTWQDALAALVPAEVLALHAVAMSYGTTTTGSGSDAATTITHPGEMSLVYGGLMLLAYALFLVGARTVRRLQWARALVPVAAFVLWTMIQPSTAFDALGLELSSFARVMIAVFGAVVLGALSTALADRADRAPTT